jgi:arylsulfatase A
MFRFSVLLLLLMSVLGLSAGEAVRPNVIVVLVDDFGWTDPHCFGSQYHRTPNIDQLARDGMRFTNGYSACTVCSPSRAALLTGQYPARLHLTDWIAGHNRPFAKLKIPEWTQHLELSTVTIAERLRAVGYATASIGKWHLGDEAFYPEKQGFDINIAGTHSPAEPEPKVHDRLDRAVRLFLRGLSPPHPRDTKARNFSAVRRFRTLVSQRSTTELHRAI